MMKMHDKIHDDRWPLIHWAKQQTKAKRPAEVPPPWDDELFIKYIYSAEQPSKIPVFLDAGERN